VAAGETHRTAIQYAVVLSYPPLLEYLKYMVDKKLLEYIPQEKAYSVTLKGRRFLEIYQQLKSILESNDPRFNSLTA
jgi:predicted transcriptional regulator